LYAVERQDDSNALTTAFAITTTGLTYVIAATAYLRDHCDGHGCKGVPSWLPLVAPAVAAAFVGFLVLNVAATRMRSVHIQRLEKAIAIPVQGRWTEPSFHTDAGLVYRPEKLFESPMIRPIFALISVASYGVIMLTLVGFTWYVLFAASGPWTVPKCVVACAYGAYETLQVAAFAWPLFHPRFTYRRPPIDLPH
ncbi:MAG: hypothetical protein J2P17_16210, partial [Mycobacterium sp.]|nr:hypothetical protein [Mycobacterium sp.]